MEEMGRGGCAARTEYRAYVLCPTAYRTHRRVTEACTVGCSLRHDSCCRLAAFDHRQFSPVQDSRLACSEQSTLQDGDVVARSACDDVEPVVNEYSVVCARAVFDGGWGGGLNPPRKFLTPLLLLKNARGGRLSMYLCISTVVDFNSQNFDPP